MEGLACHEEVWTLLWQEERYVLKVEGVLCDNGSPRIQRCILISSFYIFTDILTYYYFSSPSSLRTLIGKKILCCRKGDRFQGLSVESCLMLRRELSEDLGDMAQIVSAKK